MPVVYHCTQIIHSWLYPPVCVLCGQAGSGDRDLCPACLADLPFNHPACPRCAAPFAGATSGICGHCLHQPPQADAVFALLRYRSPVSELIRGLKFGGRLYVARLLGGLMAERLAARGTAVPERIIPVPLHPRRQRQRGFNQALELARPIARRLGAVLDHDTCRRTRNTRAQSELGARQRRTNVRGAFAATGRLEARHVAVVDDVITTGHTTDELARLLKTHGAERVEVWAAARAVAREP
ncbi:MAG: ComF family protein [Gammaproteobacteria bacterium]